MSGGWADQQQQQQQQPLSSSSSWGDNNNPDGTWRSFSIPDYATLGLPSPTEEELAGGDVQSGNRRVNYSGDVSAAVMEVQVDTTRSNSVPADMFLLTEAEERQQLGFQ